MPLGAILLLTLVAAYPIIVFLILRAVRPYRLRMADLGRELLQSPHLDEKEKYIVTAMLDDAFSWRVMWGGAFGFLGSMARAVKANSQTQKQIEAATTFIAKPHVREFAGLHALSTAAANPIGFVVYFLQVLIAMIVLRSVSAGLRLALSITVASSPDLDHDGKHGSPA